MHLVAFVPVSFTSDGAPLLVLLNHALVHGSGGSFSLQFLV